jgi:hypothetical protein
MLPPLHGSFVVWAKLSKTPTQCRKLINKLLNKLSEILLCTIVIDDSLFDCRVLPQQGRNRAAGLGTWVGADPFGINAERLELFRRASNKLSM